MLGFVQNWFAPRANAIGVDFGSDCLRLAQVQFNGSEHKLIAAASADVPQHIRQNAAARIQFFIETTRELLVQGNFRGREAILALPAASMFIQHLRIAKMNEEETKKALPWEARGKLPIDPSQALLRHLIAGEVYQDQEPKNEVIVMAAAREFINGLLAAAAKAKLDVIGMNVEPKALVDCFTHVYRRKSDADVTSCYVDIGCVGTRAIIARGQQIFFARSVPIGGDHFSRAVAHAMRISLEEAKLLRIRLCAATPAMDENRQKNSIREGGDGAIASAAPTADSSFALLDAGLRASSNGEAASAAVSSGTGRMSQGENATSAEADSPSKNGSSTHDSSRQVEQACLEPLTKLVEELDLCRRYYEATFPNKPVDRLVFVGGEARQRSLCQHVARELGIAAQLGDPLVRMGRISDIGIESGIDRRQPQPSWAVALGLSLGPTLPSLNEVSPSRNEVRA
ncbi:MAG: pilus assembly protein PilM [Anaerolineae bacterium]|nr:pilus assembly protein PilM [Phycisphaerae bacterium]